MMCSVAGVLARGVLVAVLMASGSAFAAPAALPVFTTLDGSMVTHGQLQGKVTVVAYFSSTCPYCMHEAPKLQKLHRDNAAVLTVIGVSVDRDDAAAGARAWRSKYGLTHPLTIEHARFAAILGRPKGIPSLHIFDREGRLVRSEVGEMLDEDFDEIARYAHGLR